MSCSKCSVKRFDIVEEDRADVGIDFEEKKIVVDWTCHDGIGKYKFVTEDVADINFCPFCGREL